ncbi:MAG: hypothetical protein MJK12_05370 [Colwellia sp.]|nr:hypothetical protein [Colwellia sp.]
MTQPRIKLLILSIIFIACLTALILSFTNGASVAETVSIELTSSTTSHLKPSVKSEKITTIATDIVNTKATLAAPGSQNGQMVVMHRPKWKFDGNLIVQLEKLQIASANGDDKASYILAMNLKYCYHSPADDIALEKQLDQATEFSDSELAVERITEKYQYCSGIEQKQSKQFYHYSEAAANNGYVAAQEVIGRITPEFFMQSQGYENLERDEFIIMRDNFIDQKIAFLQQAAQNGSIEALGRLSRMNRSQKIGANGYVKSFGFNQLILELTQSNEIYNRYSEYQQKLHSQLTSEEIDNGFAMSEQWLKIINANGTLYLNRN